MATGNAACATTSNVWPECQTYAKLRSNNHAMSMAANADLLANACRAAAACELDEAGTRAGGPESQELAETLDPPLYAMEDIMAMLAFRDVAKCADAGSAPISN